MINKKQSLKCIKDEKYANKIFIPNNRFYNTPKPLPLIITIVMLISMIALSNTKVSEFINKSTPITEVINQTTSTTDISSNKEMLGVWISYIELSMENEPNKNENTFRKKFSKIVSNCKNNGFNTLIVQVRPFSDALYKSDYYPYSHILSGNQGVSPNYDALKIMVEICRKNNMQIHAWVNPYRIRSNETPLYLADNNPYISNKNICKKIDSGIFLDPSNSKARELIINGVEEIVKNYDIDGIQFDDYFYPTTDAAFDQKEYSDYVESIGIENSMTLENWRKANVNTLICDTYRAIHKIKDNVDFGISPQGNLDNNEILYADVKAWCACKGFIDYICPQIYFSLDNPTLTFEECLKDWSNLEYNKNVKLYIGLAGYKAGTSDDEMTWITQNDILSQEYKLVNKNKKAEGIMLYSYQSLLNKESSEEIKNLKKILN